MTETRPAQGRVISGVRILRLAMHIDDPYERDEALAEIYGEIEVVQERQPFVDYGQILKLLVKHDEPNVVECEFGNRDGGFTEVTKMLKHFERFMPHIQFIQPVYAPVLHDSAESRLVAYKRISAVLFGWGEQIRIERIWQSSEGGP